MNVNIADEKLGLIEAQSSKVIRSRAEDNNLEATPFNYDPQMLNTYTDWLNGLD